MRKSRSTHEGGAPGGKASRRAETEEPGREQRHSALASRPSRLVEAARNHSRRGEERSIAFAERKRLYLRVGDEVNHLRYDEWGIGVVMEVMTSSVPGGTCLARVRFQDGQLRCFNNDLDNEACCYYFGVRRYWNSSHGAHAIHSKFFLRG